MPKKINRTSSIAPNSTIYDNPSAHAALLKWAPGSVAPLPPPKPKKTGGFTLVELLIVIVIIALLATLGISMLKHITAGLLFVILGSLAAAVLWYVFRSKKK